MLAVFAVLLLALGAGALASARGSAAHGSGPLFGEWWLLAAAAIAVGCAAIARLRRLTSAADPGSVDPASTAQARLYRGSLALIAVATAAVPVGLFLVHNHVSDSGSGVCTSCPMILSSGSQHVMTQPAVAPTTPAHPSPVKLPLNLILLIVGVVLVVLVAAFLAVLLLRWWSGRDAETEIGGAPMPEHAEDEQDASALEVAVLAGRGALEGEARAAVISCYAAMEASLADAGVPRLASDSPADLLARATEHGMLDGPAPRLLAALFREARFSTHPMGGPHLDQARGALDEIAAQLAARQAAEAAAQDAETAAEAGFAQPAGPTRPVGGTGTAR